MKIKATDFRAVCYGVGAILAGLAAAKQSGVIDDVKKFISNKPIEEKKENSNKVIDNKIINNALNNVYYKECFRNSK